MIAKRGRQPLAEPQRGEVIRLLKEYVAVRVHGLETGTIEEMVAQSEKLHNLLWAQAAAASEKDPHSIITGIFIQSLNEVIGHTDERYFYFGKAAARLDDLANYLPSRLTALLITIAAGRDARSAWLTWRRDGGKHKSPNAGQPESAISGALQVALGGDNTYAGELIHSPRMGEEFPAATPAKAEQAIRLVAKASLFCLAACILLTAMRKHD